MKTDLCALSATELLALYRRKKLSPVEVVRATLERIEKTQSAFECFLPHR
jgi:amidase